MVSWKRARAQQGAKGKSQEPWTGSHTLPRGLRLATGPVLPTPLPNTRTGQRTDKGGGGSPGGFRIPAGQGSVVAPCPAAGSAPIGSHGSFLRLRFSEHGALSSSVAFGGHRPCPCGCAVGFPAGGGCLCTCEGSRSASGRSREKASGLSGWDQPAVTPATPCWPLEAPGGGSLCLGFGVTPSCAQRVLAPGSAGGSVLVGHR